MAGTKRTHEAMNGNSHPKDTARTVPQSQPQSQGQSSDEVSVSRYIPMFEHFRTELDEHHDRRERVLKASKDITANSKKMIFALQRVKSLGQPLTDKRITADLSRLQKSTDDLFTGISTDLKDLNAFRYHRNISGGIQEYMEAVLFQHYLETQTLMSWGDAKSTVPGGVMLTFEDYLLGVFDLTGEMMRFGITFLATTGRVPGDEGEQGSILADLQGLRAELEALNVQGNYALGKDFDAKLKVTRQSVEKVENGVYGVIVRGKERPPGWMPDVERRDEGVESY